MTTTSGRCKPYLANHSWNVLALDLPGHCRSAGVPATVEAAAEFVLALMNAAGLKRPPW
jgi:pimeloyl-ACP methyl ester carboxylesterase